MRICTDEHPFEKCLQEIEAVLVKHSMNLATTRYGAITLEHGDKVAVLKDRESSEQSMQLPRMFDSERLVVEE